MKTVITAIATSLVLAAFALPAQADKSKAPLPQTAVSLEQAIKAVTDSHPGRVVEAELEADDESPQYEITLVNDRGEEQEFTVDVQTGAVRESAQESEEDENEADEADDADEKDNK